LCPFFGLFMETLYQVSAGNVENNIERLEMQSTELIREWISYSEAEQFCGLSHSTLWRFVSSGEIKAARIGRSVRIHLPSLKQFMERRATEDGDAATEGR
jgi:excisionase family DNA binding protein